MSERADRRLNIAPMMDRTDRHFRFLMRTLAPNCRLYTEMIPVGALLHGDAERHLRFDHSEHPVALQLGGSEPEALSRAARIAEDAGYDEINLNVGCPSERVQQACWGAALMLDPQRVAACVAAMIDSVRVPVTVKTRLGVDEHDDYEFLRSFAGVVADAGCVTLIVHARKAWLSGLSPRQNRDVPPLDYARVARLKQEMPQLEIIVNGGITSLENARCRLAEVDGIMLGRTAWRQPWLIAELDAQIYGQGVVSRLSALEAYVAYMKRQLAEGQSLRHLSRGLFGLFAGERNGRLWRARLAALSDSPRGLEALEHFVANARAHGAIEPSELAA